MAGSKRWRGFAIILVSLGLCITFAYLQGNWAGDDTYIHLRYVRNLVEHSEFTYNLGYPCYSTTSPLWDLILACSAKPFYRPGFDYLLLARIVTSIFVLLAAVSLFAYTKVAFKSGLLIVPVLFLLDPYVTSVVSHAMEQCLFVMLGALGLISFIAGTAGSKRHLVLAGLLFSLQTAARPEGIVFISMAALFLLWRRAFSGALVLIMSFVIFVTPFLLYFQLHFGSMVPLSLLAKTADTKGHLPFTDFVTMKEYLRLAAQVYLLPLIIVCVAVLKYSRPKPRSLVSGNLIVICIVGLLFLAYLACLKEKSISNRYLVNFSPFLLVLFGSAIDTLSSRHARIFVAVSLAAIFLILNVAAIKVRVERGINLEIPRQEVGEWLRDNTPEDASVYVGDIGYVGFYSERRIYDFYLIDEPGRKDFQGVLRRRGQLDLPRKIRDYSIDYVIAGKDGIEGLSLELVYQTSHLTYGTPRYIFRVVQ
jgi:hypothetical protein